MQTATIYCKSYIAQWLYFNFGNPVKLNRNTNFRYTLLASLTKDYHPHSDYNKKLYPVRVEIELHDHLISEMGHTLSLSQQHHINEVISEYMDCEIYQFVAAHNMNGINKDDALMKYLRICEFSEEHFNFETIRTRYFRFLRELNKIYVTSDTLQTTRS